MLSDLSYLSYPLPPDVQRLFEAGELARMERVIALRLADLRTPQCPVSYTHLTLPTNNRV